MILTILSCILLLVYILVLICTIKGYFIEGTGIVATVFFCIIIIFFSTFIYAGNSWKPDLDRKHELEILLAYECTANTISKAREYNKDVDKYNNYACRFTIQDRSEYYIDIDSFLEKEVEN